MAFFVMAFFFATVARTADAFFATAARFVATPFERVARTAARFVATLFARVDRTVAAFFARAVRFVFTAAAFLASAGFATALLVDRVGSAEALLILNTTVGSASAPMSDAAMNPRRM